MSNLERDLKNMLSDRADTAVTSPGDWQDLTVRMSRRNKRSKRLLASGLAVALLVGPMAGFAVARAVEDSDPTGRVTAAGPGEGVATDTVRAGAGVAISGPMLSHGGFLPPGQKLDKLFRRTTSDGVEVRAFISNIKSGNQCQGDGWCPPADCYPDAAIFGQLSTEDAVGMADGSRYGGEAPALRLTGGGAFSVNGEGAPVRYVVAQAGTAVETVRVSFEGGGSDEMAPVDGVVLLAAPADAEKQGGTVEALDGDGNVVATEDAKNLPAGSLGVVTDFEIVTDDSFEPLDSPATTVVPPDGGSSTSASAPPLTVTPGSAGAIPEHCIAPPPALPKPGEQPTDPAAAKAAVEQAFTTAYNGGFGNDDAKRAVVQDSEALTGAMEEIHNGSFAQQVKDASAKVTEVVFISPTEAAVRYDINVANSTMNFTDRIGRALLIDGVWKVARVTVCADISLAGGNCPAP